MNFVVNTGSQQRDHEELTRLAPEYPRLTTPAAVVWCDGDPFEGPAFSIRSHRLAGEIPKAREVALTGCGHYIQYGRPEAVVEAIDAVLPIPSRASMAAAAASPVSHPPSMKP